MAGLRVAHVFEQLRLGGPLFALIGASRFFGTDASQSHQVISILPADSRARQRAQAAGIGVVSAPSTEALHRELADADIVQLHFWNSPVLQALMAGELPPMRVLAWCHVNGAHAPHVVPGSLFDFSDVVAASSALSLELPVFRSADSSQVGFVFAGADFSRIAGAVPAVHDGVNVGYVGLVDFIKLHPAFVQMCAAVDVRPIHFHVCGDGNSRKEIERQARQLGIIDKFVFVDYAEDIRPQLSSFDIFGYPLCAATSATSELALQEAMYAGVPPVVFSHGGMDRLVTDGRNGLVVDGEADYVQAIERLCREPEERRRLGNNAAADARSRFGAEGTASELQSIYSRLLQKPKRRRSVATATAQETGSNAGAWALLHSLDGIGSSDLLASLSGSNAEAIAAEDRIANAGADFSNVILQYRLHYPADPQLRLWAGLLFARAGRTALAAGEFKACVELGMDQLRVQEYFPALAAGMDSGLAAATRQGGRAESRDIGRDVVSVGGAAVSIVVATRNSARYLAQALDSIAAQGFDDYQVLVVDAGSTDATLVIAKSYPKVACIQQQGSGFINAWNTGIAFSRSPFVAFLDSDDAWSVDKLALQMAVMERDRRVEAVFGRIRFLLEPGCALPPGFRPGLLEGSHRVPMSGAALFRRSVLDRVGLIDEAMTIASDISWIANVRETCVVEFVDEVVLCKRLHDSNLGHTTSWPVFRAELLAMMKQRVDASRSADRIAGR